MKRYEEVSRQFLTPRSCAIIRVDGRAFHTISRGMDKPFDQNMMDSMVYAALETAKGMQGFKLGYVQSDEASFLLTDFDNLESQGWFGYEINKVVSISASSMATNFLMQYWKTRGRDLRTVPTFDSRAFIVPPADVVNYFLWRAKDWKRNSLQMYAQSFFSHNQLHNKGHDELHEMLHQKGKNWTTDLTEQQRNGTFIVVNRDAEVSPRIQTMTCVTPNYRTIAELIDSYVTDHVTKLTSELGKSDAD